VATVSGLPLYRQSRIFEREGIDLDRSTLADRVGKATAVHCLRADSRIARNNAFRRASYWTLGSARKDQLSDGNKR
jgi:Transposase IS66 family